MSRSGGILLLVALICLSEYHPYRLAVEADVVPTVVQVPSSSESHAYNTTGGSQLQRKITIEGNNFTLDGKPLHIISGSSHYFRMPAEYWRDRLQKMKAAGLNAVATYVEWSFHEPEERQYRFEGDYDVAQYIRIAAEEGLLVLLRPGPYICAERDLGGLPYWLLSKYPKIRLRSTDPDFIQETNTWFAKLFKYLSPLLYENGGPIILVQVENEYGSYDRDMSYKESVRDIIKRHVSDKALLYTTDGTDISMIRSGMVPGALPTIDFGVGKNVLSTFRPLRQVLPQGPLMNSEFYSGWLTHWGESLQVVDKESIVQTLGDLINNQINVNFYVFYGGTNFEFSAGANYITNNYLPDITSYDYDAPLNEAGDPTPKYYAIRDLLEKHDPDLKSINPPTPAPKGNYGNLTMVAKMNLLSAEGRSKGKQYSDVAGRELPTFEKLRQRAGLVLYETTLDQSKGTLEILKPRDRVYVYFSGELKGVIDRMTKKYTLYLESASSASNMLSLLVENRGRINYGDKIHDFKGILGEVKFENSVLNGIWSIIGYPLEQVDQELPPSSPSPTTINGPVLYEAKLTIEKALDSFIDPTGWGSGYIWVNGHNLGRYWPSRGPQVTLYVPGVWLRAAPAHNTVQLLEMGHPADDLTIKFIDYPILNRTSSGASYSISPETLIFGNQ